MKELPIACTLGPHQGQERLLQWRSVGERAQLAAVLRGRSLAVTYRESAWEELAGLVRAERTCCSFLDWSLERSSGQAVLTVRADEAGAAELERLAGLFAASGGG